MHSNYDFNLPRTGLSLYTPGHHQTLNYKKNVRVKSKNKLRFKKLQMLFDDASMSPWQQDSVET